MKSNKKQAITEAALEEFSSKPYQAASLNTILNIAGTSKSSFYSFFTDKKDLYTYVLLGALDVKNQFLSEHLAAVQPNNLREYLLTYLEVGFQFAAENPKLQNLGTIYATDNSSPITREWLMANGNFAPVDTILVEVIAESRKMGYINPSYSNSFVMGTIGVLFSQFNQLFPELDITDKTAIKSAVGQCVDFIIQGLKNKENI